MRKSKIKKYYVYLHVDPKTDEVLYVGKGCGGRAWDVTRNRGGSLEHMDYLISLCEEGYTPDDWVKIIHKNISEMEAFNKEKEYLHLNGSLRFNRQCGEKQHQAKITNEDARIIYIACKEGRKHQELADIYGISRSAVSMIASGKQWKSTTYDLRRVYENQVRN